MRLVAVLSTASGESVNVFIPYTSDGFLNRERSIPFLTLASPPLIRDKNRMR
jgi:hypothetical protein